MTLPVIMSVLFATPVLSLTNPKRVARVLVIVYAYCQGVFFRRGRKRGGKKVLCLKTAAVQNESWLKRARGFLTRLAAAVNRFHHADLKAECLSSASVGVYY